MTRKLTCIICPRGCELTAHINDGAIEVKGNGCPRGKQYATDECTNPTRTVTSSVRVENREDVMVSVKTESPIPKDRIFDVMNLIRTTTVDAPVHIGDKIKEDVFGTDIVATKNID